MRLSEMFGQGSLSARVRRQRTQLCFIVFDEKRRMRTKEDA